MSRPAASVPLRCRICRRVRVLRTRDNDAEAEIAHMRRHCQNGGHGCDIVVDTGRAATRSVAGEDDAA